MYAKGKKNTSTVGFRTKKLCRIAVPTSTFGQQLAYSNAADLNSKNFVVYEESSVRQRAKSGKAHTIL